MQIHSMGAELFHADGQKDMTKLIGAFRNSLRTPYYYYYYYYIIIITIIIIVVAVVSKQA